MKCKVIFIGNSIVAGYPWSKGKSFVGILQKVLKGDGPLPLPDFAKSTGFDIINKGVNGDTTVGILQRLEKDVLTHNPDIVFIMTGTNDFIYRDASPEEAFANLEEMTRLIKTANLKVRVVYVTPIPVDAGKAEYMWMTGCGISYDAVNRDLHMLSELIRNSNHTYVDLNKSFAEYSKNIGDPDMVYLDGIHPTPAAHEFMAEEILEFMSLHSTEL